MKRLFFIILISLINITLFAQSPKSFKYQALLRDKNGILILDKNVSVRIGILQGTTSGTNVYSEVHTAKTSSSGTINLEIGKGNQPEGNFAAINWGQDSFFVKIEMDPAGRSAFELIGTSQLLSVPYALYAEKSGDQKWLNTSLSNPDIYFNSGKVGIGMSTPSVKLDIDGGQDLNVLNLRNINNSLGINASVSSNTDFHGSALIGKRSRGSFAAPTLVAAGDRITGIYGSLYANNDYQNSGAIHMYVGANPGPSSFPVNIRFETTNTNETTRTERMRITENGFVGINTTSPDYQLDVNGTINASQILIGGLPLNPSPSPWQTGVNTIFSTSGNIGIGTSTPSVKLDIDGGQDLNILNLHNNDNSLGINASVSSNTDFHGSALIGKRSRGSFAAPTLVATGDRITGIYGSLYANNDYQNAGAVHMYVGANPGASSYPVNIRFETTNTGEILRTERMRITENGLVKVTTNDVYIEKIGSGVIMKSPNGNCWRMTVDDTGAPQFTPIACPN